MTTIKFRFSDCLPVYRQVSEISNKILEKRAGTVFISYTMEDWASFYYFMESLPCHVDNFREVVVLDIGAEDFAFKVPDGFKYLFTDLVDRYTENLCHYEKR